MNVPMLAGVVGLVACGGAMMDGPSDSPVGDAVAPHVVTSAPARGATDVYPGRLFGGTLPRVRITIQFDEPMDTGRATVGWSAVGGELQQATGVWSEDATQLVVDIVGSPLTGLPPLADLTAYEIDLASLGDVAGNAVAPEVGLEAGKLRFTTGVYDPLLNHSCGHVVFGPYAEVVAAAAASPLAVRTDVPHTRYTVVLPDTQGPRSGYTGIRAPSDATWHLFLDGDEPLSLETETGEPLAIATTPTPDACDGIRRRVTFHLAALDQRMLHLGPQAEPVTKFIVEIVPDGN